MNPRVPRVGSAATALGAVAVAALSLAPVVYLFATGISLGDIRAEFRYAATTSAMVQTLQLVVLVSVLTVGLGVLGAVMVVRTTVAFPRTWTVLLTLPPVSYTHLTLPTSDLV